MTEEARAAKNEYQRAWRKANPEKVKASQERYWTRQAKKLAGEKEDKQKPC